MKSIFVPEPRAVVLAILGVAFAINGIATAQSLTFERITNALNSPVYGVADPTDANRMFVVEQAGRVEIVNLTTGAINATPFIIVPNVTSGGEMGLLGFAFHPDYVTNGKFYVAYTYNQGGIRSQIREYTRLNNDTADLSTGRIIINYSQPQTNHNGGWIDFGPDDGFLYIATGDGGNFDDVGSGHTAGTGNAQDLTSNWLGKLLRIDVNGDDDFPNEPNRNYAIPKDNPFVENSNDDEIYCWGLRNPWRNSFDRQTGDLYIGDVGQNAREEISLLLAGTSGLDFGWRLREGTIQTPGSVGGPEPGRS